MNTTFPVQVSQTVYVIPLRNARYRFSRNNRDTPHRATVTKIGRKYMTVMVENCIETRFQLSDFSSADTDDNTAYDIYESKEAAETAAAKAKKIVELRLAVTYASNKDFEDFTLEQLTDIVERLKKKG